MTSTNIYYIRYQKFITSILNARSNIRFKFSERHHIIPKCMNGTDDDDNLIYLTLREHYIAHLLLAQAYPGHPIAFAITKMNAKGAVSSRTYEIGRKLHIIAAKNSPKRKAITNDTETKYIKIDEAIPNGWRLGAQNRHTSSTKGKIRITNGTSNRFVDSIENLPEGWRLGVALATCSNKIKINNGIEERAIDKTEIIPDGFVRGRLKKSTEGTIIITDGVSERFLPKTDEIPDGWRKGRKDKGPNTGRTWVTNGADNILLNKTETIPVGYYKGRTIIKY